MPSCRLPEAAYTRPGTQQRSKQKTSAFSTSAIRARRHELEALAFRVLSVCASKPTWGLSMSFCSFVLFMGCLCSKAQGLGFSGHQAKMEL